MRVAGWFAGAVLPLLASADGPIASDQACAECHRTETLRFRDTPMARALVPVAQCEILRDHPSLAFQEGGFEWRIVREGERSIMTVTRGGETLTVPLIWAFGRGQAGQTYVFERDGALYESRVSFYNALGGLAPTMGAQTGRPKNIEEAAGRRMDAVGARECFGCHATGAAVGGQLQLHSMAPGVGCDSCHDGAESHLAGVRAGNSQPARLAKLAGQSSEAVAELCGRCHRTWAQIAMNGPRGALNVRFQPYRLANSKCYDATDARIACTACHDPHGPLETNLASYDAKCAACHSATLKTKTCPAANSNCVTCHMPKVELPGAHARFTDHQIRIARSGEPYPN
jgi:hypothetical protein